MNLTLQKVNTGKVYKDRGLSKETAVSSAPQNASIIPISFTGSGLFSKLTKDTTSFSNYNAHKIKLDEIFGDEFSKMEDELLEIYRNLNMKSRIVLDETGKVTFVDDGVLTKLLKSALYPFKDLWLDLSSWMLRNLAKAKSVPPVSNIAQNALNSPLLKKRADVKKAEELFCILQGSMNDIAKEEKIFSKIKSNGHLAAAANENLQKLADHPENVLNNIIHAASSVKGNYKTADERTLNRIFTGLVSSTMAGIDFYNISRMQNDNDALAKKSQRKRFKQESSRILLSAGMTFLSLGALSKYANSNKYFALMTISGTALVSEVLSRIFNHMPLRPLSPDEARDYSYHKAAKKHKNDNINEKAPNSQYLLNSLPSVFSQFDTSASESGKNTGFKGIGESGKKNGEKTSNILSFKNVLGAFAILLAAGLGVSFARSKSKTIDGFLNSLKQGLDDAYDMITKKDFEVEYEKYSKMLDKIDNGYKMHGFAQKFRDALSDTEKYTRITKNVNGKDVEFVKVGRVDKKVVSPLFRAITYPFSFMWSAVSFPARFVRSAFLHESPKDISKVTSDDLTSLYKIFDNASKKVESGKMTNAELEEFIKRKIIMGAENKTGKSTYKNSSLAAISRPFVTLIASYFFVNDYRNEVLITSHGEDVEGANAVAKERVMHKVSNFFFNSLLMNLFNTVFEKAYHGSLLGAGLVAAATEFTNENLIRKSIGVPTRKMTRDEIIEHDRQNLERDDFWGKYFRFMSMLTGKKTISQKAQDEEKKKQQKSLKA